MPSSDEPGDAALPEALRRILRHLVARHRNDGDHYDRIVGRRTVALAWVVDPGLFEYSPSLAALARDLGITRAALSAHAAMYSREFGLTTRGQVHGWNRRPAGLPSNRD